jgi:hypothetical protein
MEIARERYLDEWLMICQVEEGRSKGFQLHQGRMECIHDR